MSSAKANTIGAGGEALGVGFSTQSGFSTNVSITTVAGDRYDRYLACGPGGPDRTAWTALYVGKAWNL